MFVEFFAVSVSKMREFIMNIASDKARLSNFHFVNVDHKTGK